MKYNLIICGGTFDRLHEGHKAFLEFAFSKGERVIIGLTSDAYVASHKKDPTILPFVKRKKTLEDFLKTKQLLNRATIVAINSKFDQTQIHNEKNAALLVSEETYQSGLEINTLPLVVFPILKDANNKKISSSSYRTLLLPQAMRHLLQQPFGPVVADIPKDVAIQKTVTVGDATTKRFLSAGLIPKLSVVDFVVERKKQFQSFQELGFSGQQHIVTVDNPAGTINAPVWSMLTKVIDDLSHKKHTIVFVNGEEDLLVMPLVLMLPLGFTIFYGQPKQGLVILFITEKLKQHMQQLLHDFTTLGY